MDRALVAAVAEMYAAGTSTRKVQRVAEKTGVSRLSKDQVSTIALGLGRGSRESARKAARRLAGTLRPARRDLRQLPPRGERLHRRGHRHRLRRERLEARAGRRRG